METNLLESFLKIAKTGSFSAAAEELFLSQSALSKQMQKLEKELGAALFVRTSRRVTLTDAGRALQDHALPVLEACNRLRCAVCPAPDAVRIGALPILDAYGLAGRLSAFARLHPEIPFSLEEHENADLPGALDAGTFDLIFVRSSQPQQHSWQYLRLLTDELALVVRADHPLAEQPQPVQLSDFAGESFLLLSKSTQLYEDSVYACRAAGFDPRVFYCGSNAASIARLVKENAGAALFLRQVAFSLHDPSLRVLSFSGAPKSDLLLAASSGRLTSSARALWQYFRGISQSG